MHENASCSIRCKANSYHCIPNSLLWQFRIASRIAQGTGCSCLAVKQRFTTTMSSSQRTLKWQTRSSRASVVRLSTRYDAKFCDFCGRCFTIWRRACGGPGRNAADWEDAGSRSICKTDNSGRLQAIQFHRPCNAKKPAREHRDLWSTHGPGEPISSFWTVYIRPSACILSVSGKSLS